MFPMEKLNPFFGAPISEPTHIHFSHERNAEKSPKLR
jgi:hypothetical protein